MKSYIKSIIALSLPVVFLTSCDKYLDTMPDNRATLDTEEKVKNILVSAYPIYEFSMVTEVSSDNCDDTGSTNPYTQRFWDDAFAWKDETENFNESLSRYWGNSYLSIAAANEALVAIEKLGGVAKSNLQELYAEAKLCRAYNHFVLAQLFCEPWSQNAANNMGLPYMKDPETALNPQYERGTLAEFYNNIEDDLKEGLKYVGDGHLDVPKYHFNTKAAYAFATKFYLNIEEWEKAAEWATRCIGSSPKSVLRDYDAMAALPITGTSSENEPQAVEYLKLTHSCNLMFTTAYSRLGQAFGRSYSFSRYTHTAHMSSTETFRSDMFGKFIGTMKNIFATYSGANLNKHKLNKVLYTSAQGYYRTVIPVFTTDETLLNRAEAYIMLKRYDEAAADLTTWAQNFTTGCKVLTPQNITEFINSIEYSYSDEKGINGTIKKHLNPKFAIDAEGSTQESMLQCMLAFRRIENLHFGYRWFDIRRYGIEIPRRVLNASGVPTSKSDFLSKDDKRRTFQIPMDVRAAGLEENPR